VIFTEAETWPELRDNVLEVTGLHFEDAAESPREPLIKSSTCTVLASNCM